LFNLPDEEPDRGNGEGYDAHLVQPPVQWWKVEVRKFLGKPIRMRDLYGDDVQPY